MAEVPEWITNTFAAGANKGPVEAEAPVEETVGAPGLIRGDDNPEAPAVVTMTTQGTAPEKAEQGKAEIRMKGEFPAPIPQWMQDQNAAIAQKEIAFTEAQAFTTLNTGRALAQTKGMAQEIAAGDANEMARLNQQYFQRWEQENTQFRADIDAARQLRVNPNNYRQSIGRSGRVSSVLSVAVSQLSAGAGNPSMVWNRVKSTIEQDINTQKANIELEYKGIEAGQSQQKHEAAMLDKYYGFEEAQRAVAFTALEAQVGVIMQRAANEGEYQAYQMIRDRAQAEANAAYAQRMAKMATLYLDSPIHKSYQVLVKNREWQKAQAYLEQAMAGTPEGSAALAGAEMEVGGPVDSFSETGQPVSFGGAPVEAPGAPEPAVAAPPAARVAKKRPAAEAGPSPEEQAAIDSAPDIAADAAVDAAADRAAERPLTPQEADMERRLGGPVDAGEQVTDDPEAIAAREAAAAEQAQKQEVLKRQAAASQVEQGIVRRMGRDTITKGGYRYASLEKTTGQDPQVLRGQGLNTFLEGRDTILDPTDPNIAVFPSYADAVEGLKYDTRTGAKANYERNHPELFEQRIELIHEGTKTNPRWVEANYVPTAWGDLVLRKGSKLRFDQDKRDEFRTAVNTDFRRAQDIYAQAKSVSKFGTGSFLGLQIGEDGITWPGAEGAMEAMMERQSGQLGLAIQAMKLLDPSGRLTDQDILVGREYVTAILQSRSIKGWDFFTSLWERYVGKGKPDKSDFRRSISRTLKAMATKLGDAVALEHMGEYVLSHEQNTKFHEDKAEVDKWLRSESK